MSEKKRIKGAMTVAEILELYPNTMEVFSDWGLGCAHCHIGEVESLEDGAFAHGFGEDEVEALLEELNEAAEIESVK